MHPLPCQFMHWPWSPSSARELSTFAKTRQVWYAGDSAAAAAAAAAGKISDIQQWWDTLTSHGPSFGYFANAKKTWLLVEESFLSVVRNLFDETEVNVTAEGCPYLGAPLGSLQYIEGLCRQNLIHEGQPFSHLLKSLLLSLMRPTWHSPTACPTCGCFCAEPSLTIIICWRLWKRPSRPT